MTANKTLRGYTTIWAVRPEAFTTAEWGYSASTPGPGGETGLSAAKWAKGVAAGLITDISCAVEDGYSLNATGYATDSSQSVCDIAEVESPTYKEYEASLDLFRNKPGTIDTPIYDQALALFDAPDINYELVKRVDKTQGSPVEAGDILSAFSVSTDIGQDIVDDGSMLMYGARFKTPGGINTNFTVAA